MVQLLAVGFKRRGASCNRNTVKCNLYVKLSCIKTFVTFVRDETVQNMKGGHDSRDSLRNNPIQAESQLVVFPDAHVTVI